MKDPLAILLNQQAFSNSNLHLIAISNIKDIEKKINRWWRGKYKTPEKQYGQYTIEELVIEQLEDFYEKNPEEINRFLASNGNTEDDWDGTMPTQYEENIQKNLGRFFDKNRVDLSKYKSEEQVDEKEEKRILENLGRRLPGSKLIRKQNFDEFEDIF